MGISLSNRALNVKPSDTLTIATKAAALKASGKDIISLTLGEPEFNTPDEINNAAIKAIQDGFTKYTAVDGIKELKQAIINKFSTENNIQYTLDEVIVSSGAKQCLYNAIQALINPGDEVIIQAPYWVSYPDIVKLAEGEPIFVTTTMSQNFKLTPKQLEKAITKRTKLLILNSPSNPTGTAYAREELLALSKVLLNYPNVFIISDDIYETLIWGENFYNLVMANPALKERVLIVNGVSKTHSMTGWRIGYAGGPSKLINAMKNIQSQSTSNPNSIAQKASITALIMDQAISKKMALSYQERNKLAYSQLKQIEGIKIIPNNGTFYVFPNIEQVIQKHNIKNDIIFCELLMERSGLVVVPGSSFGAPGHIRLSITVPTHVLGDGINRLKQFCENIT